MQIRYGKIKLIVLFFFCFLALNSFAQEDLDFRAFKAKAEQAYLLNNFSLALQNYTEALSVNKSCQICKDRITSIAQRARVRKPKPKLTPAPIKKPIQTSAPMLPLAFVYPELSPLLLSKYADSSLSEIYLGTKEVTQKEWKYYCEEQNLRFPNIEEKLLGDLKPIINVSWLEAKKYADWLSEKTGENFDLPTLYEWEMARIGFSNIKNQAWIFENAERNLHEVGTKNPINGIYDLEGNVSEWLNDWADEKFLTESELKKYYENDENFKNRLVLGCSYRDELTFCKDIFKRSFDPAIHKNFIGFRVVKRNF